MHSYSTNCLIVNWTLRNKIQWDSNHNTRLFIHETAFENVVFEMVAILFRGQFRWFSPKCIIWVSEMVQNAYIFCFLNNQCIDVFNPSYHKPIGVVSVQPTNHTTNCYWSPSNWTAPRCFHHVIFLSMQCTRQDIGDLIRNYFSFISFDVQKHISKWCITIHVTNNGSYVFKSACTWVIDIYF